MVAARAIGSASPDDARFQRETEEADETNEGTSGTIHDDGASVEKGKRK